MVEMFETLMEFWNIETINYLLLGVVVGYIYNVYMLIVNSRYVYMGWEKKQTNYKHLWILIIPYVIYFILLFTIGNYTFTPQYSLNTVMNIFGFSFWAVMKTKTKQWKVLSSYVIDVVIYLVMAVGLGLIFFIF